MARTFELGESIGMEENKKPKIIQVVLGLSGTILVALFIILVRGSIPPLYVLIENIENSWPSFLGISSIFFFPPYFAVTGLFSLFSPKTKEGEVNARDFMASYAHTEKLKKDWIKHLVACLVGAVNASLMWILIAIRVL
jgi:hypothetical protein